LTINSITFSFNTCPSFLVYKNIAFYLSISQPKPICANHKPVKRRGNISIYAILICRKSEWHFTALNLLTRQKNEIHSKRKAGTDKKKSHQRKIMWKSSALQRAAVVERLSRNRKMRRAASRASVWVRFLGWLHLVLGLMAEHWGPRDFPVCIKNCWALAVWLMVFSLQSPKLVRLFSFLSI